MKSTAQKFNHHSALVIGKFMPMHKGHKALIDFACSQAQRVTVCVLGCPSEPISLSLRADWVSKTFHDKFGLPTKPSLEVLSVEYDDAVLNSSSESDVQSSIEWAEFLRQIINNNEIDVIVGSEKYVQYMAEYLGINHIIYDEDRTKMSISATAIKNNIVENWDYLLPHVKQYYAKHVCISGSESTGKTTVCASLEKKYPFVTMIPEIGRCLVGNAKTCAMNTLKEVMRIHGHLINQVLYDPPTPITIWDTDNITTQSYYRWMFNINPIISQTGFANKYFFFDSTIPYEKDATRVTETDALLLKESHIKCFNEWRINLEMVTENREETVDEWIIKTMKDIENQIKG